MNTIMRKYIKDYRVNNKLEIKRECCHIVLLRSIFRDEIFIKSEYIHVVHTRLKYLWHVKTNKCQNY